MHPAFYTSPRMVKPPVVYNAGLLRMRGRYIDTSTWWTLERRRPGQQLFYPPDVGGWDDTRWLDTATFRARWFIAALVQGDRSRRPTARAIRRSSSSARSTYWGDADDLDARRRRCCSAFATAQLKRKTAPADVETALRRLVATSPDLQTA